MHCLVFTAVDILGNRPEPCLKVRNCILIRVVIIYTESSSQIDVRHLQTLAFKVCHDIIDSSALKSEYLLHAGDLGSDVEVQADEVDMLAFLDYVDELVELVLGDSELVLI